MTKWPHRSTFMLSRTRWCWWYKHNSQNGNPARTKGSADCAPPWRWAEDVCHLKPGTHNSRETDAQPSGKLLHGPGKSSNFAARFQKRLSQSGWFAPAMTDNKQIALRTSQVFNRPFFPASCRRRGSSSSGKVGKIHYSPRRRDGHNWFAINDYRLVKARAVGNCSLSDI